MTAHCSVCTLTECRLRDLIRLRRYLYQYMYGIHTSITSKAVCCILDVCKVFNDIVTHTCFYCSLILGLSSNTAQVGIAGAKDS